MRGAIGEIRVGLQDEQAKSQVKMRFAAWSAAMAAARSRVAVM